TAAGLPSFLARAALEHGPIFRVALSPMQHVIFLVGPEANRFVLHTHRAIFHHHMTMVNRRFGAGVLNANGAEHAHYRALLTEAFTAGAIERHLPLIHRAVEERLDAWAGCTEIDVYKESRRIIFAIVAEAFASVPPGPEQDALQQAFDATPPSRD